MIKIKAQTWEFYKIYNQIRDENLADFIIFVKNPKEKNYLRNISHYVTHIHMNIESSKVDCKYY